MESLKNIISLNQAAKISGYTQDYLGYLIRTGEMKGVKKGRVWFTTEEAVKDYLFKKKIRSDKIAISGFLSPTRTRNIIIATLFVAVVLFLVWSNFINKENKNVEVKSEMSSEQEDLNMFPEQNTKINYAK